MRIALVVRPASGGIRRHIELLSSGLEREGFSPFICSPSSLILRGVSTPRIPIEITHRWNPVTDFRAIRELAPILKSRADVAHAHGVRGAMVGLPAALRAGIPAIVTLHNLLPAMSIPYKLAFRRLMNRAKKVIAVSEAVAVSARSNGVSADKIIIIPNGINPAPFQDAFDTNEIRARYAISLEAPMVLAIGRLSYEKGFDLLLNASALVKKRFPNAAFALAGSGPEFDRLQEAASRMNSDSHSFRLLGEVANIAELMAAADLVVIPSRQEGQGIVALEAMAAGKPIAAARVGGLIETLDGGRCGILVSPGDATAIAEGIIAILSNPDRASLLARAGRDRLLFEYTIDKMLFQIMKVYTTQ